MKNRNEIDENLKWKLTDIFKSDDDWKKSFDDISSDIKKLVCYKGKVTSSSENLLNTLNLKFEILRNLDDVIFYAYLKKDEDLRVKKYQDMSEDSNKMLMSFNMETSFIDSEILQIDDEALKIFFEGNEALGLYKRYIKDLLLKKPHVLDENEEKYVANLENFAKTPEKIFSGICFLDMKFPNVITDSGEEIILTNGSFAKLLNDKNRDLRKQAHEKYYGCFMKNINALSSTLSSKIEYDKIIAKLRNYDSALNAATQSENIDSVVYRNLIETANKKVASLHRFMSLRKKLLGYDEQYMYDVQVPIIDGEAVSISYEDVKKYSLEAFEFLGEEYMEAFRKGYEEGWIDLEACEGKNPSPYSCATYNSHPYICVSYNYTAAGASTLVHEMGHAMHYYFSNKTKPYVDSKFTIFTSEVISLMADWIFVNHLLEQSKDRDEKLQYLNHLLEQFRGMFFRTTMLAEFDLTIHEESEKSVNLNASVFNQINRDIHEKYYGESMIIDDFIVADWSRYPHFYLNFYTYKYATGLAAAIALSKRLKSGDKGAIEDFMDLLKSGCIDNPIELLKKAGVDMTSAKPIEDAISEFDRLVDEFEKILSEEI